MPNAQYGISFVRYQYICLTMTVKIVLIWLSQNKKARTPSRMTDGGEVSDQSIIKKIYSAVSEGVSTTDIGGDSQSVSRSLLFH